MSFGVSSKILKQLREHYKKGTRVQLEYMDDPQAPPVGTKGTVEMVDDIGSIHVHWDNGSGLALVYGQDSCWILCTVTTVCYGEKKVWDSRKEAMDYFYEGMLCCEGSERDRYTNIYCKLAEGARYATDED
jgi:hypothetical protein